MSRTLRSTSLPGRLRMLFHQRSLQPDPSFSHSDESCWVHRGGLPSTSGRSGIAQHTHSFHGSSGAHALPQAATLRLEQMQQRHKELCKQLSSEDAADISHQQQAAFNRELGELQAVLENLATLRKLNKEATDLAALEKYDKDPEMRQMALHERTLLREQVLALEEGILVQLLPKDEADDRDVIVEVRAGTGGDEASLFAGDLFRMYHRFAVLQGWRFEPVEAAESDGVGGYKMASAAITGGGIYGRLKYESGIHRVQRVPVTESQGRIHTSVASVAVLPQADEVDVAVRDEDIRIDTFRASGAGGQHVNTTDSAVRVTHLPSGLAVAIQDERSQHKNKAKALNVLRARIFEEQRLRQQRSLSADRREQIGSGDRSERIRTYNFPQGRVTDHRVGVTEHNIDAVLTGERLHVFIEALTAHNKSQLLASLENCSAK